MLHFTKAIKGNGSRAIKSSLAVVMVLGLSLGLVGHGQAASSPELTDRAAAVGIDYLSTPSWDVCVADVNGDGLDDFHASLHMKNAGALFTQNSVGGFIKLPTNLVSPRPTPGYGSKALVDRHACAFADVDGNGLMDIYSAAGRYATNKYKDESINNELFLQTSPGVFQDEATQAGVGESCTRGRHVAFADINGDGLPDLFYAAQTERADAADPCNQMAGEPYLEQSKIYLNLGKDAGGTWLGFRPAPEYNVNQDSSGQRGVYLWDEDGDGKVDALALGFANKVPYFYHNNGNSFTELSRAGTKKLPAMNGAQVGDLNGDGIADLIFADNNGFAYRAGTATGLSTTTVRIGANITSAGDGWNVALGDINGDGLMDIYGQIASATGSGNPDDIVYVARASGGYGTYTVPSAGGDANSVATVRVNGRAQFVVLNGGNDEKENPGPIQLIAWNQ